MEIKRLRNVPRLRAAPLAISGRKLIVCSAEKLDLILAALDVCSNPRWVAREAHCSEELARDVANEIGYITVGIDDARYRQIVHKQKNPPRTMGPLLPRNKPSTEERVAENERRKEFRKSLSPDGLPPKPSIKPRKQTRIGKDLYKFYVDGFAQGDAGFSERDSVTFGVEEKIVRAPSRSEQVSQAFPKDASDDVEMSLKAKKFRMDVKPIVPTEIYHSLESLPPWTQNAAPAILHRLRFLGADGIDRVRETLVKTKSYVVTARRCSISEAVARYIDIELGREIKHRKWFRARSPQPE